MFVTAVAPNRHYSQMYVDFLGRTLDKLERNKKLGEDQLTLREVLTKGSIELAEKYIKELENLEGEAFIRSYDKLLNHALPKLTENKDEILFDLEPILVVEKTPAEVREIRKNEHKNNKDKK